MDIENFDHHASTPGHVFFDRSVLDALCGLDRITPLFPSQPWGHFHTGDEKIVAVPQSVPEPQRVPESGRLWRARQLKRP